MKERYICIHAHFYQPPRENPWLEAIEVQDSAYPYHDWNERISAECYAPNATSRILDERGRIAEIVNNYEKISFNFGPTLLAWMEANTPEVYDAILEADQRSSRNFSGHGSALAQAYNHIIMPLASSRDKYTQIVWGIHDFKHRFGRKPEGMWLPETAVDLETLDMMAGEGIRFTILAPHQAKRARPIWDGQWKDVSGGKIDPTMPYVLQLPSGRTISVFFYDGPISRAVAFEKLLSRGESFALRLLDGFSGRREWPQLVHIATDGETYGHHHHFGDMALAYALRYIESNNLARLTNYGEYLAAHTPAHEVEIFENTSWSCLHGVDRWRADCGCNSGGRPEWNQAWREPLRQALDWLRDGLAEVYADKCGSSLEDPWAARNEYIKVIVDRSAENVDGFLKRHSARPLDETEKRTVLKLLELQRHAMLMYTSCGWFFDELSGIETMQVIEYAGRAIQLGEGLIGDDMENRFLELLERAKSNIPEHGDGRRIYEKFVRPAVIDLRKVGAHYAVSSIFEEYAQKVPTYCYTVEQEDYQSAQVGLTGLALGRARVVSNITRESARLCFGVLHFGDHNLNCGIAEDKDERAHDALVREVTEAFDKTDFPLVLRLMDQHFGGSTYSLRSLFRDEQRRILSSILKTAMQEAEDAYRHLYERHAPILRFMKDSGAPVPKALFAATEMYLNASLRRAFEEEELDRDVIEPLLEQARLMDISLYTGMLEYTLRMTLERLAARFWENPEKVELLQQWDGILDLLAALPFQVNLWKVENIFYDLLQSALPKFRVRAKRKSKRAQEWIERFTAVSERLWAGVSPTHIQRRPSSHQGAS